MTTIKTELVMGLRTDQYTRGLRRAREQTEKETARMRQGLRSAAQGARSVAAGFAGIVSAGAAISFATTAIQRYGQTNEIAARRTRELAQDVDKLRIGVGRDLTLALQSAGDSLGGIVGRLESARSAVVDFLASPFTDVKGLREAQAIEERQAREMKGAEALAVARLEARAAEGDRLAAAQLGARRNRQDIARLRGIDETSRRALLDLERQRAAREESRIRNEIQREQRRLRQRAFDFQAEGQRRRDQLSIRGLAVGGESANDRLMAVRMRAMTEIRAVQNDLTISERERARRVRELVELRDQELEIVTKENAQRERQLLLTRNREAVDNRIRAAELAGKTNIVRLARVELDFARRIEDVMGERALSIERRRQIAQELGRERDLILGATLDSIVGQSERQRVSALRSLSFREAPVGLGDFARRAVIGSGIGLGPLVKPQEQTAQESAKIRQVTDLIRGILQRIERNTAADRAAVLG